MYKKLRTIEMQRLSVDEFREAEKLPLVVVLDDVRSMHNVGSVFRTGDAFRVEAVCLCGITSTPPSAEIHKTALGAEDSVAWRYYPTALEALAALRSEGYEVYSVEQAHGSTMLQDFRPQPGRKYAVVLGNNRPKSRAEFGGPENSSYLCSVKRIQRQASRPLYIKKVAPRERVPPG